MATATEQPSLTVARKSEDTLLDGECTRVSLGNGYQ